MAGKVARAGGTRPWAGLIYGAVTAVIVAAGGSPQTWRQISARQRPPLRAPGPASTSPTGSRAVRDRSGFKIAQHGQHPAVIAALLMPRSVGSGT